MEDPNSTNDDIIVDEVEINLDMLHMLVLDGVNGEVDRPDLVAVDKGTPGERTLELMQ